jgi:parallel beta-helix repeat protein
MRKDLTSSIVAILIFGAFAGFINLGTTNALGTDVSGTIGVDTTWDLPGSPYIVIDDVTVANGVTLTVDPGVEVKFDGNHSLLVNGNLFMVGNAANKVTVSSNKVTPAIFDWNRILIESTGSAEIGFADISYGSIGISLNGSSNNNITNSAVHHNGFRGIELSYSSRNNMTGNNVSFNDGEGIKLASSSNNTMRGNNVSYNEDTEVTGIGSGFELSQSRDNTIQNNQLHGNKAGIYLRSQSYRNEVTNNTISSSKGYAVYISSLSNDNGVSKNTISYNWNGIAVAQSKDNTIKNNTIYSSNGYSLWLFSASRTRIFHNNIVDNIIQVSDDSNDNFWNDTYPSGGNYWSDYSPICADDFDGPSTPQTSGSPDGICDNQKYIDADSIDYHPLASPSGITASDGTITGRIVDENSIAVSGASVQLENILGQVENFTTSNATGHFEFTGTTLGTYKLLVSAQGYEPNETTTANLSVLEPVIDLGNVMVLRISGRLEILNPKPDSRYTIGLTIFVDGWASRTDGRPLKNLQIVIRLKDSEGEIITAVTTTTSPAGYFSAYPRIPDETKAGSYLICASVNYGDVEEECVEIVLEGGHEFPLLLFIILLIITIITLIILVIALAAMKKRKEVPPPGHQEFGIPPPPPAMPPEGPTQFPPPPPPPGPPPPQSP